MNNEKEFYKVILTDESMVPSFIKLTLKQVALLNYLKENEFIKDDVEYQIFEEDIVFETIG